MFFEFFISPIHKLMNRLRTSVLNVVGCILFSNNESYGSNPWERCLMHNTALAYNHKRCNDSIKMDQNLFIVRGLGQMEMHECYNQRLLISYH